MFRHLEFGKLRELVTDRQEQFQYEEVRYLLLVSKVLMLLSLRQAAFFLFQKASEVDE